MSVADHVDIGVQGSRSDLSEITREWYNETIENKYESGHVIDYSVIPASPLHRLDHRTQARPWHDLLYLGRKELKPGRFPKSFKVSGRRKGQLGAQGNSW